MISVYMVVTCLAAAVQTTESSECDLSEPAEARPCFGVLGEPLVFHLPLSENTKVMLRKKNTKTILYINNNTVLKLNEEYKNRSFTTNGTFRFDKIMKKDAGEYVLENYDPEGKLLYKIKTHLEIQAPVSEPTVSQTCLSEEQMKVTCSSEGHAVRIILYLDGRLLTAKETEQDAPSFSNITVSLHGEVNGNLMCQARNDVSTSKSLISLKRCKESTPQLPLVAVVVRVGVVALLLALALFLGIKHLRENATSNSVSEGNHEDEVIYSDVRVMKNPRQTTTAAPHNAAV